MFYSQPSHRAAPARAGAALLACVLGAASLVACSPAHEADSTAGGSAQASVTKPGPITHRKGQLQLAAVPDSVGQFLNGDDSKAITYYRIETGMHMGSATEHQPRYALSLIKLYIATYVLERGSFEDKYVALDMIADSSDESAAKLFEKYPRSIDVIAKEYGLESTSAGEDWGHSMTSTYDVVRFIVQLMEDDPTHPVLVAMSHADAVSADGYQQDYGTAKLSDVVGSKWGWSDSKDRHSSVSFGEDFVVAASIEGSAEELTSYVRKEITGKNLVKGNNLNKEALANPSAIATRLATSTATTSATSTTSTAASPAAASSSAEPSSTASSPASRSKASASKTTAAR
ncbi:hypothetical protein HMPREF2822_07410 [Corynebacterium sp. HMSC062E11]|uniref:hypothetical protein n=1 Tax=Corynebacterium sp. HMSC062E11 TaxID=1739326 RepID=UPI0008A431FC|nr:hypothetical protein [Corynebacterium sp. HMSC062E11]MDK6808337.1 hypothetical protein [Corynebacterium aurimucosum]NJJ84206.1 hypothetical protein [Corynebacterium aurimucosum]OFK26218.1 hypothetical protein HMPREF2822_07410 [Corynebacterium sp. HMSC062E11]OFP69558.1 hypothetical protein HMPREF2974_05305 [Corynebacterium sp. HMSC078C09]